MNIELPASARSLLRDVSELGRRGVKFYRIHAWCRELERRFRHDPWPQQRAEQLEKLAAVVAHAATQIPFYRDHYAGAPVDPRAIRSFEAFARLPIVTKDDVRKSFPDRIVWRDHRAAKADFGRSSGTTGESVPFIRQESWKKNHYYGILQHRPGRWDPVTGELQTPQCSAASCSIRDRRETLEDRLRDVLVRTRLNAFVYLPSSTDIFRESDAYFEDLVATLVHYRAEMLWGASNYLGQFARWLTAHGRRLPLHAVICTNELLLPSVQAEIHEAFVGAVYNHYGSSEVQGLADQCDEGLWHLRVDTNLVEIVNDGKTCAPGEPGHVLVTDLDNYWMPLIRYQIGDLATMAEGPCRCGRTNPALLRVEGRAADAWQGEGGKLVTPAAVARAAFSAGLHGRYRVVQESLASVSVQWADGSDDARPRVADALAAALEPLLGARPRVSVTAVRSIAPERSNKYRLVYSKVPPRAAASAAPPAPSSAPSSPAARPEAP